MDVEKVFHMTGGLGDTSYAKNSSLQKKASDMVKHITLETLREVYLELTPDSIGIADLGCSSTPNTLSTIKDFVEVVEGAATTASSKILEFRVYLNDLPSNDFNTVFKALPDFYRELKEARKSATSSIYTAGCPGSFYGRVFPNNCLHFIHSSYSMHWLSKIPNGLYDEKGKSTNKGTIYISKSSPPSVSQAYTEQFQEDFSLFLQSRSEELVLGGRMVAILLGRRGPDHVDRGNSFFWELLTRSFAILVTKGHVEQEQLDSYDVHFYAPSKEEIEEEVRKQGSFVLDRLEIFTAESGEAKDGESYGTMVANAVRAIQESMISNHFGKGILDILFENYGRLVDEEMVVEDIKPIAFALVLRKVQ